MVLSWEHAGRGTLRRREESQRSPRRSTTYRSDVRCTGADRDNSRLLLLRRSRRLWRLVPHDRQTFANDRIAGVLRRSFRRASGRNGRFADKTKRSRELRAVRVWRRPAERRCHSLFRPAKSGDASSRVSKRGATQLVCCPDCSDRPRQRNSSAIRAHLRWILLATTTPQRRRDLRILVFFIFEVCY